MENCRKSKTWERLGGIAVRRDRRDGKGIVDLGVHIWKTGDFCNYNGLFDVSIGCIDKHLGAWEMVV